MLTDNDMKPLLEPIAKFLNYADLPETWQVPDIGRFSAAKTLYDYQTDALQKAARAFYLYYGKEYNWSADETEDINRKRKQNFANLYGNHGIVDLKKYERMKNEKNGDKNQVFKILSEYIAPQGDSLPYHNLINRMCFWMATGSGKTLVMVKLIEYLHSLKKHRAIPPHNILILAPSDHLLGQIRRTIDEFNQSGLHIDLVPLRRNSPKQQWRLGDAVTVYYHRSDNISDIQKDALTDYRSYENGGKWYVLLDEAHKGGKEDSKRQAYYKIMAREGFLFNFSATFTDQEDIVTTVKKYNLEEFIHHGHGKNIYLNKSEFKAFANREREVTHDDRRRIVLKSLITLAHVTVRVQELRRDTGLKNLYHLPLMLTLANSVNTDIKKEKNDLWAFFQILHQIATGEIDEQFFEATKRELIHDWGNAELLFGEKNGGIIETDQTSIKKMTMAAVRRAIFLSNRRGALQFIRSGDNKELAFQMKNSDTPFALIRIGDTSKWRGELLAGYEETTTVREKSFFDELEQSPITMLMGSRSFFESWDSNRPNVINFINIGGRDAKKFVVQSVGRGVRIETLPNQRRRFGYLLDSEEKRALKPYHDQVQPPETLFLFATNRDAIIAVLKGIQTEQGTVFKLLEGIEQVPLPQVGGQKMPLLIPQYREERREPARAPFYMSDETLERFKQWLTRTSDSVFVVRDGLTTAQIASLRGIATNGIKHPDKHYTMLSFLQNRLISHLSKTDKVPDGVRNIDDKDIVHFRQIGVHSKYAKTLQAKINQVREGEVSDQKIHELVEQLMIKEITREQFDSKSSGKVKATFKDLTIKKLLNHYYMPVILGNEKAHYIQHIIKVKSERDFLEALEKCTAKNKVPWDNWMFSKIDESVDNVHIPYYDDDKNDYRRFLPDFIFWMCRRNEYQIVFVDPKGMEHTAAYRKIDGYMKLFQQRDEAVRRFKHGKWRVSVKLFFYNPAGKPLDEYQKQWLSDPADIFEQ